MCVIPPFLSCFSPSPLFFTCFLSSFSNLLGFSHLLFYPPLSPHLLSSPLSCPLLSSHLLSGFMSSPFPLFFLLFSLCSSSCIVSFPLLLYFLSFSIISLSPLVFYLLPLYLLSLFPFLSPPLSPPTSHCPLSLPISSSLHVYRPLLISFFSFIVPPLTSSLLPIEQWIPPTILFSSRCVLYERKQREGKKKKQTDV